MSSPPSPSGQQQRAEEHLRVFRAAASLLASSLEFDAVLAHAVSACLPALGDFGFFDVVTGDEVRRTARAYQDPELEAVLGTTKWVRQERSDMNLCALSTGQPALHQFIDDDWYRAVAVNDGHLEVMRNLAFRSMITVPMRYRGELIGSLTLFMAVSGRRHCEDDYLLAQEIASLAAPTVVNARLLEERQQSETALRLSEERLRLATDAGRLGIWDWNIPQNRVTWSERVHELHGLAPGSFGGKVEDFGGLVHPDDLHDVQQRIQRAIECENSYTAEFRTVWPDGTIRWLATRADVYRDADGNAIRMVGATSDVTERVELLAAERAARAEAEAASRAKDEFLAMLGHELRNPLAPIANALQLMKQRGDESTLYEQGVIARQVSHLSRLVDDLLDISRITRGKVDLSLERLDLTLVLGKAMELARPMLEQKRIALDVELPSNPLLTDGDSMRLIQVFSNLLGNAAKFTPPDGRVQLRAFADGGMIVVELTDSGIGISAELLPHIFGLFVQGPQRIDRQLGGLGLGLSIAKTLVGMHGGEISAASEGENQGATFMVKLPMATALSASPSASRITTFPQCSARVLVVDDNVDAGETVAELLRTCGCDVRFVPDGETAIALIASWEPDVAILDIGLPGMDGYQLAGTLRKNLPAMSLIALTGYSQSSDRRNAIAAGFHRHLIKPVDVFALATAINEMTANR